MVGPLVQRLRLRIGMTRAEVVAAAGEDANPDAVGGPNPDECDEFRPARAPRGLLDMLEDGILTRISLSAGTGIRTASGIGVGDPAASVMAAHGAAVRTALAKVDATLHELEESIESHMTRGLTMLSNAVQNQRSGIAE